MLTFVPGDLSQGIAAGENTFSENGVAGFDDLLSLDSVHFDTGGIVYRRERESSDMQRVRAEERTENIQAC